MTPSFTSSSRSLCGLFSISKDSHKHSCFLCYLSRPLTPYWRSHALINLRILNSGSRSRSSHKFNFLVTNSSRAGSSSCSSGLLRAAPIACAPLSSPAPWRVRAPACFMWMCAAARVVIGEQLRWRSPMALAFFFLQMLSARCCCCLRLAPLSR